MEGLCCRAVLIYKHKFKSTFLFSDFNISMNNVKFIWRVFSFSCGVPGVIRTHSGNGQK